jgi:putative transcriptional regulator
MIFVESRGFSGRMGEFMDGEGYRALQNQLIADPTKGSVIPGCGGLRKVRVEDAGRGRGTRGGARVIYLSIPAARRIDLVAIYGKDERDDLSAGPTPYARRAGPPCKARGLGNDREGAAKVTTSQRTGSVFEQIKEGLEDSISYSRGRLTLATVALPAPPPTPTPRQITELRLRLQMSQAVFAATLNVSKKTVQSWEQGRRVPSDVALRMLQVVDQNPDVARGLLRGTAG